MSEEIIDLNKIKEIVDLMIKFQNTPKLINLKKESPDKYHDILSSSFNYFKLLHPGIFDIVASNEEENISMLYNMFDMKNSIDNGADKDKVEKNLGEILAQKYVYPVINKK